MWRPIALSNRQAHAADRIGGIELILPWPEGLPKGGPLPLDEERDATAAEHRAAEEIVGAAARAADLVPVRSVVAMLRRPRAPGVARQGAIEQHLCVIIIGRRWVHATTSKPPREMWAGVERIVTHSGGSARP